MNTFEKLISMLKGITDINIYEFENHKIEVDLKTHIIKIYFVNNTNVLRIDIKQKAKEVGSNEDNN